MEDVILFLQSNWLLTSAFGGILILLMLLEFLKNRHNTHHLNPARAVQLINHENAAIIDIRNSEAFNAGHIVGAISAPINELPKKIEKFKTQPIILVCATGVESARIATTYKQNPSPIYILAGGIRAWKEADLPLVKGST